MGTETALWSQSTCSETTTKITQWDAQLLTHPKQKMLPSCWSSELNSWAQRIIHSAPLCRCGSHPIAQHTDMGTWYWSGHEFSTEPANLQVLSQQQSPRAPLLTFFFVVVKKKRNKATTNFLWICVAGNYQNNGNVGRNGDVIKSCVFLLIPHARLKYIYLHVLHSNKSPYSFPFLPPKLSQNFLILSSLP